MSTKQKYSVQDLRTWYRSLSTIHREYFKTRAHAIIELWIEKHNAEGILPAQQLLKELIRPLVPVQRACVQYFLERTIKNGAHFSIA